MAIFSVLGVFQKVALGNVKIELYRQIFAGALIWYCEENKDGFVSI